MELNAEQIKKALECCISGDDCTLCPLCDEQSCPCVLNENALSLIKELTEENERLRERNITLEQKFVILNREEIPVLTVTAQKERTTVIPKSKIDDIYASGLKCGVRKLQELIYERLDISVEGYSSEEIKSDVLDMVDQIVKELLEGNNENNG